MQQRTTGRDYTKSSQLFTNKYYSTIASKLKLTLFEILIKLETLANSIQLFYTYFKTSFNLLSTFFPSKTRAQRHVASRVFECSFYLTTFHLHDLLLNISRRVSAFLLERRREKDLESMIYHQFQNFFILFQHAWSRFPSFNQGSGVKTAEFPRDATQRCSLHTSSGLDSFFSTFSLVFLPETGQQYCQLLPNPPQKLSQVLCSVCHLRCNHTFFHRD